MKVVTRLTVVFAALALCAGVAHASDPVGVYAIIDKVTFEPNGDRPERVVVTGVFAQSKPGRGSEYEAPQRGVLYFKLAGANGDTARKEWNDLKSVAGKKQVIAFGSRYGNNRARIRKADDKLADPDTYDLSLAPVKVRSNTDYAPVKALLEAAK